MDLKSVRFADTLIILYFYSFFFILLAGAVQRKRKGTLVNALTKVP